MSNKGYPLPDEVDPADDICLIVRVPNSPEYLDAFLGAYTAFGAWSLWERDEQKRGRDAAARWRETIVTHGVREIACDIANEIDGEGNMAINVNVQQQQSQTGCGCGCDGGNGFNDYVPPDWDAPTTKDDLPQLPTGFYDDGTYVPDDFTDRQEYDEYKCNLAGQLVDDFIQTIGNMSTLSGAAGAAAGIAGGGLFTSSALAPAITGLMAVGMTFGGAVILLTAIFALLFASGVGLFAYFGYVHDKLLPLREEMTCRVFRSHNTAQAKSVFVSYTNQAVAAAALSSLEEGDFFTSLLYQIIDLLVPEELLTSLFDPLIDLITGDAVYDCTGCATGFEWFAPLLVRDNWQLGNGWQRSNSGDIINRYGQRADGTNHCSNTNQNYCRQGVELPSHSSPTDQRLYKDFTAEKTAYNFTVIHYPTSSFAQDCRVNVDGSQTDFSSGAKWVAQENTLNVTGLTIGQTYRLEFSGSDCIVHLVEEF